MLFLRISPIKSNKLTAGGRIVSGESVAAAEEEVEVEVVCGQETGQKVFQDFV